MDNVQFQSLNHCLSMIMCPAFSDTKLQDGSKYARDALCYQALWQDTVPFSFHNNKQLLLHCEEWVTLVLCKCLCIRRIIEYCELWLILYRANSTGTCTCVYIVTNFNQQIDRYLLDILMSFVYRCAGNDICSIQTLHTFTFIYSVNIWSSLPSLAVWYNQLYVIRMNIGTSSMKIYVLYELILETKK